MQARGASALANYCSVGPVTTVGTTFSKPVGSNHQQEVGRLMGTSVNLYAYKFGSITPLRHLKCEMNLLQVLAQLSLSKDVKNAVMVGIGLGGAMELTYGYKTGVAHDRLVSVDEKQQTQTVCRLREKWQFLPTTWLLMLQAWA